MYFCNPCFAEEEKLAGHELEVYTIPRQLFQARGQECEVCGGLAAVKSSHDSQRKRFRSITPSLEELECSLSTPP